MRFSNRYAEFQNAKIQLSVPEETLIMNQKLIGPRAILDRPFESKDAIAGAKRLPYGLAEAAFASSLTASDLLRHVGHKLFRVGNSERSYRGLNSGYGTVGYSEAIETDLESRVRTVPVFA